MKDKKICGNCKYHNAIYDEKRNYVYQCRRYAPSTLNYLFPLVDYYDWCGDFEKILTINEQLRNAVDKMMDESIKE